jgi:pimeloyl-ACP methyl ester carboxylesterase
MISASTLTIGDIRSPVLTCGPDNAREGVVFVHGIPGPKEDWVGLMGRLPPHVRAVAPDMPGFGAASRPRHFDYTVQGYSAYVAACLEQLGIDQGHLVLHDFAGWWGLTFATGHPDLVRSLTLINTGIPAENARWHWHWHARVWQTPVLGKLYFMLSNRFLVKWALNSANPRPFPDEFVNRIPSHVDRGQARAVLKLYRSVRDIKPMAARILERLPLVMHLPTLVVFGSEDPYLPTGLAEAQRKFFPGAEVHVLDDCGHWPFVDDLNRVAALVIPFLEGARTSPLQ